MYIAIEGNIGSGKSTLIRNIKSVLDVEIIDEPDNEWRESGWLDLLYKYNNLPDSLLMNNPKQSLGICEDINLTRSLVLKYFALIAAHTRANKIACVKENKSAGSKIYISERSSIADVHVFPAALQTNIDPRVTAFEIDTMPKIIKPDIIIYLRPPVEECYSRLQTRGNPEDTSISKEYLYRLQEKMDTIMARYDPIIISDNNAFEALKKLDVWDRFHRNYSTLHEVK